MLSTMFPPGLAGFVLDAEERVVAWSDGQGGDNGGVPEELDGGRELWRRFYRYPRLCVAQLLLRGDHRKIMDHYGPGLQRCGEHEAYAGFISVDIPINGSGVLWNYAARMEDPHHGPVVWNCFHPWEILHGMELTPIVRTLIDKFPLPVALVINQRTRLVNAAYARLTGFNSPEELEGLPPEVHIDEEDRARFIAANANMHAGIKTGQVYHWRYRTRTGRLRHVEGRPAVFPWGSGMALISTVTDITEKVERDAAMTRSRALLEQENALLLAQINARADVLVGESSIMRETVLKALRLAGRETNLVILGETGTGKSLLAKLIHEASPRKNAPFVVVNCAAIPENLLESEFFGYKKGAFTNALADKKGLLGAAHGGTLFLDEVAELSLPMQAKLLHAIEAKQYMPVGGNEVHATDVRLLCATNRDLKTMKQQGTLRDDFYYRIFVVDITMPPLRDRIEDLPLLAQFFFDKFKSGDVRPELPESMLKAFAAYSWPGNVRELQNVILRYIATGTEVLPATVPQQGMPLPKEDGLELKDLHTAVREVELRYCRQALEAAKGNKVQAARLLGMNLRTFHRYCARLGLGPQRGGDAEQ